MFSKASISWNVKQVVKMLKNNNISLENAVQRGYEWSNSKASLFIHSLIVGYPVPPFYAARGKDKVYDMLDGKQRLTSLLRFYNGEFSLKEVPGVSYTIDGQEIEMAIDDCKYENLPEEFRDNIDSYSLLFYYFDDITEDQIAEMFFRMNNGKPVSSSVLTRIRALSRDKIKEIGQHPIFDMALTKKALENFTNEDIAIKALYILNGGDNLETGNIRTWISETEITNAMATELGTCLSRLQRAVETIEKEDKKTAKKIITKVHMISLLPIINKSREDKIKDDELANILKSFYGVEGKASKSNAYNDACTNGVNKTDATTKRLSELEKHYTKAINK